MTSVLSRLRELEAKATYEFLPGYLITEDGAVYSIATNWRGYGPRRLKTSLNRYGYHRVRCSGRAYRVHRLVALAFLPTPPPGSQIRHLDGDKNNNHISNLRWGTARDNADDRERHGHTARGSRNGWAKLADSDVLTIRAERARGIQQLELAARYGVCATTIRTAERGTRYRDAHACLDTT